ncbi:hypothetical protein Patl1_35991 [Pistacia atlantica]|nr:hypothetical protein Patl1_35991 [Pistacia atlantica]
MEDLLVDRDLWGAIVNDRPTVGIAVVTTSETSGTGLSSTLGSKPAEGELSATDRAALAEWDKMDRKARGLIRICLEDSVLTNVMDQDTAKGLWQKLENMYLSKSLVNVLFRRKKLYNLRMHDGDSLAAHLDEFNTLVNQLLAVDVQLTEFEKVVTLLCSLPDTWDNLIVAIGGGGLTQMSWESVCSTLLAEDMRRRGSEGSSRDALTARGRNLDRNSNKSGDRGKSNKPVKGKEAETSYKRESNGDMYVAAACMAGSDQSVWYVDTGASFQMTPHKEWFCEYETYNGGNVLHEDNDDSTDDEDKDSDDDDDDKEGEDDKDEEKEEYEYPKLKTADCYKFSTEVEFENRFKNQLIIDYKEQCLILEEEKKDLTAKLAAASESLELYLQKEKDYLEDRNNWFIKRQNLSLKLGDAQACLEDNETEEKNKKLVEEMEETNRKLEEEENDLVAKLCAAKAWQNSIVAVYMIANF